MPKKEVPKTPAKNETRAEANRLIRRLVRLIQQDPDFEPTVVLGLPRGGWIPATIIATKLGITSANFISVPVKKEGDVYRLDQRRVRLVLKELKDGHVLVVDDTSDSGDLTYSVVKLIEKHGGIARSCVLIANRHGRQPDYVGKRCNGKPSDFDM